MTEDPFQSERRRNLMQALIQNRSLVPDRLADLEERGIVWVHRMMIDDALQAADDLSQMLKESSEGLSLVLKSADPAAVDHHVSTLRRWRETLKTAVADLLKNVDELEASLRRLEAQGDL